MYYVDPSEVLQLFTAYIDIYGDTLPRDKAIEELQDALDDAKCEWVEVSDEEFKELTEDDLFFEDDLINGVNYI